jgi:hypothetical protein
LHGEIETVADRAQQDVIGMGEPRLAKCGRTLVVGDSLGRGRDVCLSGEEEFGDHVAADLILGGNTDTGDTRRDDGYLVCPGEGSGGGGCNDEAGNV